MSSLTIVPFQDSLIFTKVSSECLNPKLLPATKSILYSGPRGGRTGLNKSIKYCSRSRINLRDSALDKLVVSMYCSGPPYWGGPSNTVNLNLGYPCKPSALLI